MKQYTCCDKTGFGKVIQFKLDACTHVLQCESTPCQNKANGDATYCCAIDTPDAGLSDNAVTFGTDGTNKCAVTACATDHVIDSTKAACCNTKDTNGDSRNVQTFK